MKTSTQKVEFTPPPHSIPEGTEVGEDFVETCTFRVKDAGKICLVVFGETELPGYKDKATSKEDRPSYAKYRKDVQSEPSGEPAGEMGESGMMG